MADIMKQDVGVKTSKKAPQKLKKGGPVKSKSKSKKMPKFL